MAFSRLASRTAAMASRRVAVPTRVQTTARRMMSHDGTPEELQETADMWRKISVVGTVALIAPFSLYMLYIEATHEHHEHPKYAHLQIRSKAYPWGDNCDLLDGHCRRHAQEH